MGNRRCSVSAYPKTSLTVSFNSSRKLGLPTTRSHMPSQSVQIRPSPCSRYYTTCTTVSNGVCAVTIAIAEEPVLEVADSDFEATV